jgi:hypothetical protein
VTPQPQALDARVLGEELVKATGDKQDELFARIKTGETQAHTEALAVAIQQLKGDLQAKARDALIERLAGLRGEDLTRSLVSDQAEIRRAAALVCKKKNDKGYVPGLISLLDDSSADVTQAARDALATISGQNFGPEPGASDADHRKAVEAWKGWWMKQVGQ